MNRRYLTTLIAISCLQGASCARTVSSTIDENVVDAATAAATAISGTVEDEVADAPIGNADTRDGLRWAAAACERLSHASCVDGVRAAIYAKCRVGGGSALLSGSAELDYTNSRCSLSLVGDGLSRKSHDLVMTLANGGVLYTTTDDVTDYVGDQFGSDGTSVRISRSGYVVAIQARKALQRAGDEGVTYDLTERTDPDSPLIVEGGLGRKDRLIRNGTVVIYHNLAKFTARHHLSNVSWGDPNCCFPLKGRSTITFSGAVGGLATIDFGPGCGQYTLTKEEDSRSGVLTICGR